MSRRERSPRVVEAVRQRVPVSPEELADLYVRYYRPLLRRAIRKHNFLPQDAQDLVHEVFALALEKMELEGNARAWFITVLDNLAANEKRKTTRRADLMSRFCG